MAIDEGSARMRAHHNNIDRYRMLLETELSDVERQSIERRLAEEQQAADELATRPQALGLTLSGKMVVPAETVIE